MKEASSTIVEDDSFVKDSLSIRSLFCCGSLVFAVVKLNGMNENQKIMSHRMGIPFEIDMNNSESQKVLE